MSRLASAEAYTASAVELAEQGGGAQPTEVKEGEWMSLGVFAAAAKDGGASGVEPSIYLQLAVSKEGVIAGTVYNKETDKSAAIGGMIDRKSKRAAWAVEGKSSPIMECGIANLTKDEASALLHFDGAKTQQWTLLRLEEPKEGEEAKPAPKP